MSGIPDRVEGCDAENPGVYMQPDGSFVCRCMVCARCGHHTGNSNQGHYWRFCGVTKSLREFHFCCPGDCSLESHKQASPSVPSGTVLAVDAPLRQRAVRAGLPPLRPGRT